MKKRYVYLLLVGVPGFFISLIIAIALVGTTVGLLWIYVFGDDTWPASTDKLFPFFFVFSFLLFWLSSLVAGLVLGKNLEDGTALNKKHILISTGATIVPVLFIVLYQLRVGNIGPKPDSIVCSEFCRHQGYVASGMSPADSGEASCRCFDDQGQEALKVLLHSIGSAQRE